MDQRAGRDSNRVQSALGRVAPSIGQRPRGFSSSATAGANADAGPGVAAPIVTATPAPASPLSPPPSIDEQKRIGLSHETPWHHTLALAVACLLALLVHALIVGLLFSQIWLFAEEVEEQPTSLEDQVIAVVELPPPEAQPEEAQGEEAQPEQAQPEPPQGAPVSPNDPEFPANQIDIGRVNQGSDTGGGETAQTGTLAPPEQEAPSDQAAKPDAAPPPAEIEEPPTPLPEPTEPDSPPPEPEPLPTPIVPPPELAETPPEVEPLPVPETELSAELTLPTEVPPADLPEITRPSDQPEPDPAIEELNLDSSLTEVLVTAALDREGEPENPTPNGPMAVPPVKPQREVTLPPVPKPARSTQNKEKRGEQSQQRSGRQASNAGAGGGQGGGYGGGSETNYLGLVARELNRQKVYPPEALAAGEEGTVIVRFAIDDEGWVIARRILKSSGYRTLDAEVMDLLIRASPLPKPPGNAERLTMTITLRFYR